jgi:hypothetical protein
MKKTVSLKLEGERITAHKFRRSISDFYSLLDEITNEISGQRNTIQWFVSVKESSIHLISQAEPIHVNETIVDMVINALNEGLEILEERSIKPKYFTDYALEYVEDMAYLPSREDGLNRISIIVENTTHIITPHTIANISSILELQTKAIGSIEGKLLTLTRRGGSKFVVYDSLTDRPIRCYIPDEMMPIAISGFDQRVYVFGLISYGKDHMPKSIKVEDIKIFPSKEELPTAFEICGILGE